MMYNMSMKTINPQKTVHYLVKNIKSSFQRGGFSEAVIGVSGGIDSAVSLTLTCRALGASHVHPVMLPYGKQFSEGIKDAREFIVTLGIPSKNTIQTDIQPFVDTLITRDPPMDRLRRGNIMARMRMILLFDLSKKLNALVVGTENKTEHLLGYYTRFGDEGSDIEPLRHVYKTHVYVLAHYLDVPRKICTKPPTAGLWEGQTDEGEIGCTYKEIDEIVSLATDEHLSKNVIIKKGFNEESVEKVWKWIEKGRLKDRLPIAFRSSV
jgi:NAD+ synthase